MTELRRVLTALLLAGLAPLAVAQPAPDAPAPAPDAPAPAPTPTPTPTPTEAPVADPPVTEEVSDEAAGETIEVVDRAPPGARAEVSSEVLEREEPDDLHEVLRNVAGVYVRDEDGYGLRPNIGMRGGAADRSAKVTIMEDGVLSGPAPYTAPAAYYVPLVTRMSRVDVTKGPSAIRFGPATVGGAIDLIGEPFPAARAGYVDIAGGSDRYGKVHLRAAERYERWGVMGEYVKLRTDGFKELDGGGDTGFDKNDVQLSARYNSAPSASDYHVFEVRAGYGDETSNETYTGLTDEDFAAAPQRRYAGSQLDQMNWTHWRLRATHRVELGLRTRLDTAVYRHKFHRAWGKVDGFVGQRDFYGLVANPDAGANAIYYAILSGQADSSSPEEQLVYGTNDRRFTSQGVQTALGLERTTGPVSHHVDAGVRIHFDRADRTRFEDTYDMVSGSLVRAARPRATVLDSRAETIAMATFVEDKLRWKRLEVAIGTRLELIDFRFADRLGPMQHRDDSYAVLIPGGGAEYHVTDQASVLAGVHRGFVPVAPALSAEASPESSTNYEAGGRWRGETLAADVIGFFSDYSNLKGTCTLAAGCTEEMIDAEFDGGGVHVYGVEAQLNAEVPLARGYSLPLAGAYTFTRTAFQQSFSSEFAGWGDVAKGDELPYVPHHLVSLTAGMKHERGNFAVTTRYQGAARDVAGRGEIPDAERTAALLTVDLSAHFIVKPWAELYATCNNLLDEQVIISRRPYGARPNPPRLIAVGYKARF